MCHQLQSRVKERERLIVWENPYQLEAHVKLDVFVAQKERLSVHLYLVDITHLVEDYLV
jgi:hypothetical protein